MHTTSKNKLLAEISELENLYAEIFLDDRHNSLLQNIYTQIKILKSKLNVQDKEVFS
ncbi:MAG TPA: hypothetical protein VNS32_27315 [Flavisolibacter sp.]|nr:hypothetical protein [Flavisolibacter sp.]